MPITTGAYGTANAVTKTTAANFIPQLWSDDIIASYKRVLVMAQLVRRISVVGQKGGTLNIPSPIRGQANAKVANTVVTIQQATEANVQVVLNKHYEYSRLIEDIVSVQALNSLRQFYADDAGYALARQMDIDLVQLGRKLNGGPNTAAYTGVCYIGGDGSTLYTSGAPNQTALTSAGLRRMVQRLDDNDVPMDGRVLFGPPSMRNTMMGIQEYVAQSYVGEVGGGNTIRNGKIGDVYGIPVFISPNADTATGGARIALLFQRDALVLVENAKVRTQTQYKQEYLADLLTADTIYGVEALRPGTTDVPTGGYAIALPA